MPNSFPLMERHIPWPFFLWDKYLHVHLKSRTGKAPPINTARSALGPLSTEGQNIFIWSRSKLNLVVG
jgi:hypothetical protein